MEKLHRNIESLIFASEQPISLDDIQTCLGELLAMPVDRLVVEQALETLTQRYQSDDYAFEINKLAGGYQFLTKAAYYPTVSLFLKQAAKKKLSQAALETLSIIAYKQPIVKSELEEIRGVSCDYAIQKLLEKELISIVGRSNLPGKPLLYATSEKFMQYFGINTTQDLPKLKDFKEQTDNEIGTVSDLQEDIHNNIQK